MQFRVSVGWTLRCLRMGADFVIISAHKTGGPKGIGALILANAGLAPSPLLKGGGQENYHRAGTENVAAIAGFGAAVENLPARQAMGRNRAPSRFCRGRFAHYI